MITAVDSNVILDLLTGSREHGARSAAALRHAATDGAIVASTAVWAEVVGAHDDPQVATERLDRLAISLVPDDRDVAIAAGPVYRAYRLAGGTRRRILPCFLIGAHALVHADRLLTRDRGFYRSSFRRLAILEP
ncbi:MAG: type II toxin-antitoxin system VapC family toxin [Candidatus Limnocylindria bacterium]